MSPPPFTDAAAAAHGRPGTRVTQCSVSQPVASAEAASSSQAERRAQLTAVMDTRISVEPEDDPGDEPSDDDSDDSSTLAKGPPLVMTSRLLKVVVVVAELLVDVFQHVHKLVERNIGLVDHVRVDARRNNQGVISEAVDHLQQVRPPKASETGY